MLKLQFSFPSRTYFLIRENKRSSIMVQLLYLRPLDKTNQSRVQFRNLSKWVIMHCPICQFKLGHLKTCPGQTMLLHLKKKNFGKMTSSKLSLQPFIILLCSFLQRRSNELRKTLMANGMHAKRAAFSLSRNCMESLTQKVLEITFFYFIYCQMSATV